MERKNKDGHYSIVHVYLSVRPLPHRPTRVGLLRLPTVCPCSMDINFNCILKRYLYLACLAFDWWTGADAARPQLTIEFWDMEKLD